MQSAAVAQEVTGSADNHFMLQQYAKASFTERPNGKSS